MNFNSTVPVTVANFNTCCFDRRGSTLQERLFWIVSSGRAGLATTVTNPAFIDPLSGTGAWAISNFYALLYVQYPHGDPICWRVDADNVNMLLEDCTVTVRRYLCEHALEYRCREQYAMTVVFTGIEEFKAYRIVPDMI